MFKMWLLYNKGFVPSIKGLFLKGEEVVENSLKPTKETSPLGMKTRTLNNFILKKVKLRVEKRITVPPFHQLPLEA